MKRYFGIFMMFALAIIMAAPSVFAEDAVEEVKAVVSAEAQETEVATAEAVVETAVVPEPVPAEEILAAPAEELSVPAESTTEPTPSVNSIDGSISAVDIDSDNPSFKLKGADGQESEIYLDFDSSQVWEAGEEVFLEDLEAGQSVKVRYVEAEGKKIAKTVEIASA